ncbi:MAG: excinuclease ABC subunit UvrC [Patescibacteria group bacterium]|jgi:excinuclease ABC subunit C
MYIFSRAKTPASPGCYLMKNSSGEIIYIGKAKNLRSRVGSYFNRNQSWKTEELVRQIAAIEFIVTRNEVEALILEARLIRQHRPKFNLMLKDNQPYFYIKITDEEFPRLTRVRQIGRDGKYFGPFVSGQGSKYLLLTVARLFGLRTDKFISRSARELYQLLSEIRARDLEKISAADYRRNVHLAEMFLRGRKDDLLGELERRMKTAAAERNFELAKLYRDQIHASRMLSEKQLVSLPKSYDQDAINFVIVGEQALFQVFNIKRGIVTSRDEFSLQLAESDDRGVLAGFLEQYYLTRPAPREIIIPEKLPNLALIKKYFAELKGAKVDLLVPQKGDKRQILDLVRENILTKLSASPEAELQGRLSLPALPRRIDGFDISNTSGLEAVGSCVRFAAGRPDKNLYRRFKIKTVVGPNDYAMLKEVIGRRYRHGGWEQPDLLLIDGGKGQLGVALKVLQELKLNLPVCSLAKKREEVFIPGQSAPVIFDRRSGALKLLQQVRDEAHRFAIGYHKLLRKKRE